MSTTLAPAKLEMTAKLERVAAWAREVGISLNELLDFTVEQKGICAASQSALPEFSTWVLAYSLDEGVRLLAIRSADHRLLPQVHLDSETFVAGLQHQGRKPTLRDVVVDILESVYGDDASAELAAMEKRGDL